MFLELVKLTNNMVVVIPDLGVPQRFDLRTHVQVLQSQYDPLSTPRQKKPVSRTVDPRPGPWTQCPPFKK
ncbi:hypothetical protein J6590_085019 [Homalodisca vitripennis]|nr:hypothetical protein J6590_085019 [Homalodisca vitripennis]